MCPMWQTNWQTLIVGVGFAGRFTHLYLDITTALVTLVHISPQTNKLHAIYHRNVGIIGHSSAPFQVLRLQRLLYNSSSA